MKIFSAFILHIIFFLSFCLPILGQKKYEKEYRINELQFPKIAVDYVKNNILPDGKIKYYLESDSTKESFEAKFKINDYRYSVEFDKTGILEDIEVIIDENKLSEEFRKKIGVSLDSIFEKHRILKIQIQYPNTNSISQIEIAEAAKTLDTKILHRYELLVAGRKKGQGYKDYELLFSQDGKIIKVRTSVPPAYGYILY